MKRKQLPLPSIPVRSLRPSGSAYRFYSEPLHKQYMQKAALVSIVVATQVGDLEIIKYHVENSSKDHRNEFFGPYQRNLLHLAAISSKTEVTQYILDEQLGDVLAVDSHGNLPYQLASGRSKELIIRQTLWEKRKVLVFWFESKGKIDLPLGIFRSLCSEHFGL